MSMTCCCVSVFYVVFFFKQKTAYEMRISDWSSDVCSSDLLPARGGAAARMVGEQLRGDIERLALEWEDQALGLTVSVGVATRLRDEDPRNTIDRADKALYAAQDRKSTSLNSSN